MITLTDGAIKAVERFIANSDKPTGGLRIEVTDGGCSGLQYGLRLEAEAGENDSVMDYGAIKVFVDAESLPSLDGMTVDFLDSVEGSGFKFTNPNAVKSCACGTSFSTNNNGGESKSCTPHSH
ncbi:MAG: iron-sulfur cluster assembly accessory protein [Methylococcales bacterium]|nr:iron-sulfur cluster assembly accessory protein [Methylococcales bacterium]MDD5754879.1 iron-sulfur cluster assembly accessory protein [Methylococcales bacterium]